MTSPVSTESLEVCIVRRWMAYNETQWPGHSPVDFIARGHRYVRLLLDTHVPLEEHPGFAIVDELNDDYTQQRTPLELIIADSHCWRRAILETVSDAGDAVSAINIAAVHRRIDELQLMLAKRYAGRAFGPLHTEHSGIDELHDDRLSLLGKMAAAMAHEIRNPLFAIEGFLKLIKAQFIHVPEQVQHRVETYMEVVEKEFDGLYRQITSFLSFSKQGGKEETAVVVPIGDIVDNAVRLLLPRAANENVELTVRLESSPPALLRPTAIQQVLINLINNGMDAMADSPGSKRIEVRSVQDIDCYRIIISNNGPVIPEDIQRTMFEPFVTTKKNGTGLGLAICRQIMQQHGGDLAYTPQGGETAFTLTFLVRDCTAAGLASAAELPPHEARAGALH